MEEEMIRRLDEIRERLKNATPGKWHIGHISQIEEDAMDIDSPDGAVCDNVYGAENRDFILNSKQDIAYLLRIAEAAEVMRKGLCWNLEIFAKSRFLTNKDSNAHKSIIHDSMDEGYRDTEEALAKAKELMGE